MGALCRELLARGKDYCTLFVNRENPISNRVYRKTGFQVLEDCWEYRLEEPLFLPLTSAPERGIITLETLP